MMFRWL